MLVYMGYHSTSWHLLNKAITVLANNISNLSNISNPLGKVIWIIFPISIPVPYPNPPNTHTITKPQSLPLSPLISA